MPYYAGKIVIGPNLKRWIDAPTHRRFASEDWVRSLIRFGTWRRKRRRNYYYIQAYDVEGHKRVKIQFVHYPNGSLDYPYDHIFADHAHLF